MLSIALWMDRKKPKKEEGKKRRKIRMKKEDKGIEGSQSTQRMNEERRREWRLLVDFLVSRDLANDCRKRKEGRKEIRKRVLRLLDRLCLPRYREQEDQGTVECLTLEDVRLVSCGLPGLGVAPCEIDYVQD